MSRRTLLFVMDLMIARRADLRAIVITHLANETKSKRVESYACFLSLNASAIASSSVIP